MREAKIKVYKVQELEEKAKERALQTLSEWNTDYDWWDWIEENDQIRLKSFDLYHHDIEIDFTNSAEETAKQIIKDHGESTDTYKTSIAFLNNYRSMQSLAGEEDEEKREELIQEYKHDLSQDYLALLQSEYDYRTSEEALIEFADANEYEWHEDGTPSRV